MAVQYNHVIELTSFNYLNNLSEVSIEENLYRQQALSNTGSKNPSVLDSHQCPRENNVRLYSVQQTRIYAGDQEKYIVLIASCA